MATAPVKSPLHNFPLTSYLKWSSKNHHNRCRRSPLDSPPPPPPPLPSSSSADGSRSSRNPRRAPSNPAQVAEEQVDAEPDAGPDGEGESKPWNLRPRRGSASASASTAAMKAPAADATESLPKSMRLRGLDAHGGGGGSVGGGGGGGERGEKRKFWIALSREEIEEDIYSLTGSKPSRRPKRRPKNVQKQLDNLSPGLWLVGLSPEVYRSMDVAPKVVRND